MNIFEIQRKGGALTERVRNMVMERHGYEREEDRVPKEEDRVRIGCPNA